MASLVPRSVALPTMTTSAISMALPTQMRNCCFQSSSMPSSSNMMNRNKISARKMTGNRMAATAEMQTSAAPSAAPQRPALPTLDGGYETVCSFASYSNWLLPGALMLGRYPFVEPSQCLSREQGEKQLDALIMSGITTFYCLQDELPPQDDMRLAGVNGFLPYKATATLLAAALSDPPGWKEISGLRTPQLDKFLPKRRNGPSPSESRRRIELEFAHSPIVDLGLPSEEQLKGLIKDIVARIERGERVYLHCWGGRGRAGTVGAAVLSAMYGLSADEALERVQRSFDTRKDEGRRSPETDEQHAFVRRFIDQRLNA